MQLKEEDDHEMSLKVVECRNVVISSIGYISLMSFDVL